MNIKLLRLAKLQTIWGESAEHYSSVDGALQRISGPCVYRLALTAIIASKSRCIHNTGYYAHSELLSYGCKGAKMMQVVDERSKGLSTSSIV